MEFQQAPLPLESWSSVPPTYQMDLPQTFYANDGLVIGPNYGVYDERQTNPAQNMGSVDENVDAGKGPRLTSEQLVILEDQFSKNYKPNTEHKRVLADSMGVEYAKVNNWFQNRRAKAKQETQARQRADRSHHDSHAAFVTPSFDYRRASASQGSVHFSSPEQAPVTSDSMGPQSDPELDDMYHPFSTFTSFPSSQILDMAPLQLDTAAATIAPFGQLSPPDFGDEFKNPSHTVQEIYPEERLPQQASVAPSGVPAAPNHDWQNPPMYHGLLGDQFVGNPSMQSFGTSLSEESEQTKLITPPQEASPLSGFNQSAFQHDRHASNSSDLVEDLNTVHIQPPQADLGIKRPSVSAPQPNGSILTGLPTPDVSPDTVAPNLPLPTARDIAARRKRPRPAALQPEANRSASYAGPATLSPHLRPSPPGSGKISPVRRIRSTGNNTNVLDGRIKKPGTATAQRSPRHWESCFKAAESERNPEHLITAYQNPDTNASTLRAPSPQCNVLPRQGTWPRLSIPATWDQGTDDSNVSYAHSMPASDWPSTQTNPMNQHLSYPAHQMNPHHSHPHCPPQSAPSHITSFDTAGVMSGNASAWAMPNFPPDVYRDDSQLQIHTRQPHMQHHSLSGPFNQFDPSLFQPYPPSMGGFPGYSAFPQRTPTPSKPLDIKIEKGPAPPPEMTKALSGNMEYTFENSFSHEPHFKNGTKK
ncbi:hypothetical protein ACLMJK_004053 [Lecanora helva]